MRVAGEILGYCCIAIVAIELMIVGYGLASGSLDFQKIAHGAAVVAGWDETAARSLAAAEDRSPDAEPFAGSAPVSAELPKTDEATLR